jgi:hypothetical protein
MFFCRQEYMIKPLFLIAYLWQKAVFGGAYKIALTETLWLKNMLTNY